MVRSAAQVPRMDRLVCWLRWSLLLLLAQSPRGLALGRLEQLQPDHVQEPQQPLQDVIILPPQLHGPLFPSYSVIKQYVHMHSPNLIWVDQQGPFFVQDIRQVEDTILDLVSARLHIFHHVNIAHLQQVVDGLSPVGQPVGGRGGLVGVSYNSGELHGWVPGNFSRGALLIVALDHQPKKVSARERVQFRRHCAGDDELLPYTIYANGYTMEDGRQDTFQFRMLLNLLLVGMLSRRRLALLNVDMDICTLKPYWSVLAGPAYDVADIWFQSSKNGLGTVVGDVAGCAGFMLHRPSLATLLFLWKAYHTHFSLDPLDDQASYAEVIIRAEPVYNVSKPSYPEPFTGQFEAPAPPRFTTTRAQATADTAQGLTFSLPLPKVTIGWMEGHLFWRTHGGLDWDTRMKYKDTVLLLHAHDCEGFFTNRPIKAEEQNEKDKDGQETIGPRKRRGQKKKP
eukprot:g20362.t1